MTIAETISAQLGDDGQRWETADGRHLETLCVDAGAVLSRSDRRDADRYSFADGSVITATGGGWDMGYQGCYCWRGVGHTGPACRLAWRVRVYWDNGDPNSEGWAYWLTRTPEDPGLDCSGPIDDETDLDHLLTGLLEGVGVDQITVYGRGHEDRTEEDLEYLRRQLRKGAS